jgi:hypothetical protein
VGEKDRGKRHDRINFSRADGTVIRRILVARYQARPPKRPRNQVTLMLARILAILEISKIRVEAIEKRMTCV